MCVCGYQQGWARHCVLSRLRSHAGAITLALAVQEQTLWSRGYERILGVCKVGRVAFWSTLTKWVPVSFWTNTTVEICDGGLASLMLVESQHVLLKILTERKYYFNRHQDDRPRDFWTHDGHLLG